MNLGTVPSLLLASGLLLADFASAADIVVAPVGDDAAGRGTAESPYATPERAQVAVRALIEAEPERSRPVVVALRGGHYALPRALVFGPADSGTERAPVHWTAWPGEQPVLSGGVRLTGWEVVDGHWRMQLPEVARGEWSFSQLFVDGQRRYRPRLPREGYHFIAKELPPTRAGKATDRFGYRPGEFDPNWSNLNDVEVLAFHYWGMSRLRVASVEPESRVVTFTGPTCSTSWWGSLKGNHRFLIENVREAFGQPGEWYLDRRTGVLVYTPLPGEDPETAAVVAPRLGRLVELRGDAQAGMWVENLHFEGIGFAHANWVLPPQGYSYAQAEAAIRGAIHAEALRDSSFVRCRVARVGTYGIDLAAGCWNNRIEDCEIFDLGAGGIRIGEGWGARGDLPPAGKTVIRNNTVAFGGRMHPAGIGVWLGLSPENLVEHNDIHDFYYSGLSVGWTWGYHPTPARNNVIQHNHVHHIGQGVLSDMGGIYTLGLSPGTVIRHNCFHDIDAFDYGGWGIYFDEGSTGIVAEDNLVYRTKTGGFHQHYGRENMVRNNIFAFARTGQLQRTRPEEHSSFTFERNIVLWSEGPLLHGNWGGDRFLMDRNLYWHTTGSAPSFPGNANLAAWRQRGHDRESLVADPLFADPAAGDFRLLPGSPAARIGFVPFPLDGFGRTTPPSPAVPQDMPRSFPAPPPPPPPMPIEEDFELVPVGQPCPGARTYEDATVKEATARVTDETAAGGNRSLKLVDRPGQKNSWDPHVHYSPNFSEGLLEGNFDLRFDGGSQFNHEWRDNNAPYRTGPSIRVNPDGTLVAAGNERMRLPLGEWVRIRIVWGMTEQTAGRFTLAVTLPGQESRLFADLPCDPECRSLRWYGFVSEGRESGTLFIDNIRLAPVADATPLPE